VSSVFRQKEKGEKKPLLPTCQGKQRNRCQANQQRGTWRQQANAKESRMKRSEQAGGKVGEKQSRARQITTRSQNHVLTTQKQAL
jgi:hypothetical protein